MKSGSTRASRVIFGASPKILLRIRVGRRFGRGARTGTRGVCTPHFIVERPQRLQHVGVIAERQRRVQSADDVQFRDADASASRAFWTISSTDNWKPSASRFLRANEQNWHDRMQ